MDSETNPKEPTDSVLLFETKLETLVLDAFTDGVPLENTWTVTVPIGDAPNWTVTIEKTYSEEGSSYRPTCLEE